MILAKGLLRKIKLSKIIDVNYSNNEQEIIDILDRKLKYLTSYVYNDVCVYTNVCSDFIFEANHRNKKIYVSKDLWDLLDSKINNDFSYTNYINTQKLFDYFIKHKYEHYISFYVMPKY